jgi:tetratricopeptide (TPR) repeat protein
MNRDWKQYVRVAVVCGIVLLLGPGCNAQAKKSRHLSRADHYLGQEKYNAAVIEYLNVLKLDPTNAPAIRQLGRAYYMMGDGRRAYWYLRQARQNDPADMDVAFKLGAIYLQGRKWAEARDIALEVVEGQPTNVSALALLADASVTTNQLHETQGILDRLRGDLASQPMFYVALGNTRLRLRDTAGAGDAYRKGLAVAPASPELHLSIAHLHRLKGEAEAADAAYRQAAEVSPPASSARIRWATFKAEQGQVEEAQKMLEEILTAAPEYTPARFQLADLLYRTRKFDESLKALRVLLKKDPENVDARLLSAKALAAQGRAEEGLAEMGKLAAQFPKAGAIRYELALIRLQGRNVRAAMKDLADCLALEPQNMDAALLLAELNIRTGNSAAAVTALEALVAMHPAMPRVLILLGAAYQAQGRPADAADVFRRLVAVAPKSPQNFYLLGRSLREGGMAAEATRAFEAALELDPLVILPLAELAAMEMAANRPEAATLLVERQILKAPTSAAHQFLLGRLHMTQGSLDKAEAAMLKSIELRPEAAAAYLALARIYAASGKEQEAIERLEAALEKNPKDIGALMLCGTLYQNRDEVQKARSAYERLLAVNPGIPAALNNLAYLYAEKLNDIDKAYELAQKAREAAPEDPFVADTLGWILYRKGDPKWALSLLQEASQQMPREPEILYHVGMAHLALGSEAAAVGALERAVAEGKPFAGAEEAAATLALLRLDPGAGMDDAALLAVDAVLKKDPANPAALLRKGQAHELRGEWKEARSAYEKALGANELYVPAMLSLARLQSSRDGDHKRALALARKAREILPQDPDTAGVVAWLAVQAGELKWATSLLEESVRQKPADAVMHYRLGYAYCLQGRLTQARQSLARALELSDVFADADAARACLAMIDIYVGSKADAASDGQVKALLAKQSDDIPALLAMARIRKTQGDAAEAKAILAKIVDGHPEVALAMLDLAELLASAEGGDDRAYRLARRAHDLLPGEPRAAVALGKLSFARKDYLATVRLLGDVPAQYSADADLYYCLGLAQYRQGNKDAAREALTKALALKADSALAEDARKALAELK